eukprot:4828096-Pyramimonas_sp.AAC.1
MVYSASSMTSIRLSNSGDLSPGGANRRSDPPSIRRCRLFHLALRGPQDRADSAAWEMKTMSLARAAIHRQHRD